MPNKTIQLKEEDIHRLVKECVFKIIKEYNETNNRCNVKDAFRYEMSLQEKYGLPISKIRYGHQLLEQRKLYEGLIKSYDYSILCDRLKKIGCDILQVQKQNGTPLIYVSIPENSYSATTQLLTQCGWYVINDIGSFVVITPKFGEEITDAVYNEHGGILYHTTPTYNLEKIMRQGLVPRSGKKIDKSQDLVHFMLTKNECESIAHSLSVTDPKHPDSYILFKIDLSQIPNSYLKPRFFSDPKYPGSIITKDNIPPFCLEKLFSFKI